MQGKVIKTKSVEYMPFLLSLVSFLNGCCWTAYALIRFDLYVTVSINRPLIACISSPRLNKSVTEFGLQKLRRISVIKIPAMQIPNALGAFFGLIQLILYFWYYKSTPKKEKNVELPTVSRNVGGGNVTVSVER